MNLVTKKSILAPSAKWVNPLKLTLLATGIITTLTGCASIGSDDFACPGIPSGVKCMSTRDVYEQGSKQSVSLLSSQTSNAHVSSEGTNRVLENYVTARLEDRPIPVRTPALVMRIWIATWQDNNGDLIAPGYLYTEVESRKWVTGGETTNVNLNFNPLKVSN